MSNKGDEHGWMERDWQRGVVTSGFFACQIACKFMLRFSIFFLFFVLFFYILFSFFVFCDYKILWGPVSALVKNANITEIYVIIQSACGIFLVFSLCCLYCFYYCCGF